MKKFVLTNRQKGTFCMILSAFSFAWMNAFVRLSGDLPFLQKSFFSQFRGTFICTIYVIASTKI